MDKGTSPEEKLLRLIRGRGKKEKSAEKSAVAVSAKKKPQLSFDFLEPLNKFFRIKIMPLLGFKTLNIFLISLLAIFIVYFVIEIFSPIKGRIKKIADSVEVKGQEGLEIKINEPKDYSYYYQQFAKRDIFNAPLLDKASDESGLSANVKEAIKSLKLVGIILDKEPQAIIEDTAAKSTHFLNEGDSLDKLEVKDISESKVILIYGGEEFELEL